jgi:electron transfer flavoprotein beta subunit
MGCTFVGKPYACNSKQATQEVVLDIVVCVKYVPDPNVPNELDGKTLKREGVQGVLDPGDEFGVEAALQLKEEHGGEVTVVSMGPEPAMEAVRRALSMGADQGVLATDEGLAGADALATATVLSAVIARNHFDLVIAAVESTDGYTGTMPMTMAEFLGVPQITFVNEITESGDIFKVRRQTPEGYHIVECPLPAVMTVTAGLNEPRYASFKGIMAAKKKPTETLSLSDIGLSADDLNVEQTVEQTTPVEESRETEMIEGHDAPARIAEFLAEAKVI